MIFGKRTVISLGDVCTSNCVYCDFPQLQKKARYATKKELDKGLDIINYHYDNNTNNFQNFLFRLEGGEPGDIPENILQYWYENCHVPKYLILSQGLYFEKGYHIKFKKYIGDIMYHVLSGTFIDRQKGIKEYDGINKYLVVVGEKNFDLVEKNIKKYSDKEWHLSPETICKTYKKSISNNLRDKILYLIDTYPQVQESHVKTQMLKMNDITLQNRRICANDYSKPYIDIKNMKIKRCIASYTQTSSIDLTKENLGLFLQNKTKLLPTMDKICETCEIKEIYRNYFKEKRFKELKHIIGKINE